jgi:hypothetical protein
MHPVKRDNMGFKAQRPKRSGLRRHFPEPLSLEDSRHEQDEFYTAP